jgi:hypothetical protein
VISVVYILGTGSVLNNIEIRYSLRSIERYLTGYDRVWVIGECPAWLQNVYHIPFQDRQGVPSDFNIMSKVTRACQDDAITDPFLFFNDDHFLLHPFTASEFPYFYHGTLEKYIKQKSANTYAQRANNTIRYLKTNNLPLKHFDIHYPIIYKKELFLKHVTSAVDWNKTCYIIKSMYANSLFIEGEEALDYKLARTFPPVEAKVFSTTPKITPNLKGFLKWKFPKMSRFEKTGI